MRLAKLQYYQQYTALEERRENWPDFDKDVCEKVMEIGQVFIHPGERFCRIPGCHAKKKFSQVGNLRNHLRKAHRLALKRDPTGALSYIELQKANKFYESLLEPTVTNAPCDISPRKYGAEGLVTFHAPHQAAPAKVPGPCQTWYKLVGSLNSTQVPLVVIHGGPGACHDYLLPLIDLNKQHSIPILFYDQLGNGKSTRLPHLMGDEAFWREELFIYELSNLISSLGISEKPYDVFGHSWGGMLATTWAASKPRNLRKLIIASSLASMETWQIGVNSLVERLPEDVRETLRQCVAKGDYESEEYQAATDTFLQRHLSLKRPWPSPEVKAALEWLVTDPTSYTTMYGRSDLSITGSLRNWTSIPYLNKIEVPTLLINGEHDEAQDVAMRPFFEHIPKVKWVTVDGAAHLVHVDQREKHMWHLSNFLLS